MPSLGNQLVESYKGKLLALDAVSCNRRVHGASDGAVYKKSNLASSKIIYNSTLGLLLPAI